MGKSESSRERDLQGRRGSYGPLRQREVETETTLPSNSSKETPRRCWRSPPRWGGFVSPREKIRVKRKVGTDAREESFRIVQTDRCERGVVRRRIGEGRERRKLDFSTFQGGGSDRFMADHLA